MYKTIRYSDLPESTRVAIANKYLFWRREMGIANAFEMVRRKWRSITNVTVWKCVYNYSRALRKQQKRTAS